MRAHENLAHSDGQVCFADWAARIAVHRALAQLAGMPPSEPRRSSPYGAGQGGDVVHRLECAVDDLPDEVRVAFTLCALDRMPACDAAETLGIALDVVQRCSFRGRLQARRGVGVRFDEAESRVFGLTLSVADRVLGQVRALVAAP